MSIFSFPEDPVWNEERESVEFPVEVGEFHGLVIIPRRIVHNLLGGRPSPELCVEYCFVHRMEFERITEIKIRARELNEDANILITGKDIRRAS